MDGGWIHSRVAGVLAATALMIVGIAAVLGVTGLVPAFTANRGFLQLFVAVPLACLLVALLLSWTGVLRPDQLVWAPVPSVLLVALGASLLDLLIDGWPAVIAIAGLITVPWMLGLAVGTVVGEAREEGR